MPITKISDLTADEKLIGKKRGKSANAFYENYYKKIKSDWEGKILTSEKAGRTENPFYNAREEFKFNYDTNLPSVVQLDRWLIKHGEIDTHARSMVAEFIIKPELEKLLIWYIIQNKDKKNGFNKNGIVSFLTDCKNNTLSLNVDIIKRKLRKGIWKRIITFNTDNIYWGKIGDAVQIARPWLPELNRIIDEKKAIKEEKKVNENIEKEEIEKENKPSMLIEEEDYKKNKSESLIKNNEEPIGTDVEQNNKSLNEKIIKNKDDKKEDTKSELDRLKDFLTKKINEKKPSEVSVDDIPEIKQIKEELSNLVSAIDYETKNDYASHAETIALKLNQFLEKSCNAYNISDRDIGFFSSGKDYTSDLTGAFPPIYNAVGQFDNLLTVGLSVLSICNFIRKGEFNKLDYLEKFLFACETGFDSTVAFQSTESLINMVKTINDGKSISDVFAASEHISERLHDALPIVSIVGNTLNLVVKFANMCKQIEQRQHARNADVLIANQNDGFIRGINKHTKSLKKHKEIEGTFSTVFAAFSTASSVFAITGVGLGLGLVLGFAGAAGAFATWITGLVNRRKRRRHLIDNYFGIDGWKDEEQKKEFREYAEARLSIVGDERMARYILHRYAKYLYNAVFIDESNSSQNINNESEADVKDKAKDDKDESIEVINTEEKKHDKSDEGEKKVIINESKYVKKAHYMVYEEYKGKKNFTDKERVQYGAYEILRAYGIKPKWNENGSPKTTEADIYAKLEV